MPNFGGHPEHKSRLVIKATALVVHKFKCRTTVVSTNFGGHLEHKSRRVIKATALVVHKFRRGTLRPSFTPGTFKNSRYKKQ